VKSRTHFSIAASLLIISIFIVSCKKETSVEPADKFTGNYSYTLNASSLGVQIGKFAVKKRASDKLEIITTAGDTTFYSVSDSTITEDIGQINYLPVSVDSKTIYFEENSTGYLRSNVLTIDGSWTKPGYETVIFQIVANRK